MRRLEVDVPALLKELKIEGRRTGGELRGDCPNPSHAARPGPGSWQIKLDGPKAGMHVCYACKFGGGPVSLIQAVLDFDTSREAYLWLRSWLGHAVPKGARTPVYERKEKRTLERELPFPKGALKIDADHGWLAEARGWLEDRGVSIEEAIRHKFAATPQRQKSYGGRIIVPVVVHGRMVDFVARLYVDAPDTTPKALSGRRDRGALKELALWGYDALDYDIPVVHVVEGVWDALHLLRNGIPNVVASCGSAWSEERTELLSPWERIVLIPDGDAAGKKMIQRASSLRFTHNVGVVELPYQCPLCLSIIYGEPEKDEECPRSRETGRRKCPGILRPTQPEDHPGEDLLDFIEDASKLRVSERRTATSADWGGKEN